MKFEIGDEVEVITKYDSAPVGIIGVIILSINNSKQYGVSFYNWGKGHSCDGRAKQGTGYYVNESCLETTKPKSIEREFEILRGLL